MLTQVSHMIKGLSLFSFFFFLLMQNAQQLEAVLGVLALVGPWLGVGLSGLKVRERRCS